MFKVGVRRFWASPQADSRPSGAALPQTEVNIYIYIYIYIYIAVTPAALTGRTRPAALSPSGLGCQIGYSFRGVQWEGGAVDGGSILQ